MFDVTQYLWLGMGKGQKVKHYIICYYLQSSKHWRQASLAKFCSLKKKGKIFSGICVRNKNTRDLQFVRLLYIINIPYLHYCILTFYFKVELLINRIDLNNALGNRT